MCHKLYREVLDLVSAETEIPVELITAKCRLAEIVDARQLVAYFCYKAGMNRQAIADKLGISRQAVCQKIETINDKRMLKSFEFNFKRIENEFAKIFPEQK